MHASYAIIYKTENIKSFQVDKLLHKLFCNIIYSLMKHLCRLMSSFIYVFNSQLWIKIAVFCQKYWRLDVCVSKFLYGKQGYTNSERPEYLILKQITFMLITSYDITISQTVPTECIILHTWLLPQTKRVPIVSSYGLFFYFVIAVVHTRIPSCSLYIFWLQKHLIQFSEWSYEYLADTLTDTQNCKHFSTPHKKKHGKAYNLTSVYFITHNAIVNFERSLLIMEIYVCL